MGWFNDLAEEVQDWLEATPDVDVASPGPTIKAGKILSAGAKAANSTTLETETMRSELLSS